MATQSFAVLDRRLQDGPSVRAVGSRPAAPEPRQSRPGLIASVRALRSNPITAFAREAYEQSVLDLGRFRRVLLVNDPDEIEHVLLGNAENYRKSIQQQRRLRPALGEGLLTAEDEAWRRSRRVAAPLFSPKAIAQLLDDMRGATEAMRDRWLGRAGTAEPLDLAAEFQRLAYEIVSRTVFSGALDADRARIHANMAIYFDTFGRIDLASILNLPSWLPTPAALRARPALAVFRSIVDRIVAQRRQDPGREVRDLLDHLMLAHDPKTRQKLPLATVADNVLTFLAAGHETTGNALSWILYLLSLYPETEETVAAELHAAFGEGPPRRDLFGRLVMTRAVIDEALRLYPPAPFIGREAIGEDTLAGRPIKPGTQVLISPWIVHRHRLLWEEPDAFRPERFLPREKQSIRRGAFIPFGLGPRTCIGESFAVQEMITVLAVILPAFRFSLADPQAVFPEARITLQPRGGMPAIVIPRKPG